MFRRYQLACAAMYVCTHKHIVCRIVYCIHVCAKGSQRTGYLAIYLCIYIHVYSHVYVYIGVLQMQSAERLSATTSLTSSQVTELLSLAWRGVALGGGGDVNSDVLSEECVELLTTLQCSWRLS